MSPSLLFSQPITNLVWSTVGTGRPNRIDRFLVSKTLTFTRRLKDEFYLQENENQFHINTFVLILALKQRL